MNSFCIFICCVIVFTGCISSPNVKTNSNAVEETAEERIPRLIDILHLSKSQDYWRLCQEIIDYKEEALPHLARSVTSFSPKVRTGCMYCIAGIYKNTNSAKALELKDSIHKRLEDTVDYVQLEAAASLCDLGDYRGVPVLIGIGLRNNNVYIRIRSQQTLKSNFKVNLNYRYDVSEKDREAGINRWEKWWEDNKGKYIKVS